MKHDTLQLVRRLTILLIISGALNASLLAFLIYWMVKERPPTLYCEHLPVTLNQEPSPLAASKALNDLIDRYRKASIRQLTEELSNGALIDGQLAVRDLALAFLVTYHHFDLQRAMQSRLVPKRQKFILTQNETGKEEPIELFVFPPLKEGEYEAILQFARTEEWPITPLGMFIKLQQGERTPSLEEAFYHTPQFMAVDILFSRVDKPFKRGEALQIVLDGSWDLLSSYYSEQRTVLDLSRLRCQKFLLSYVDAGSKAAAYLLLKVEGKQPFLEMDDDHLISLLELMAEPTPAVVDLAMTLVKTSKSQRILQAANDRLKQFGALNLAPQPKPKPVDMAVASNRPYPRTYVVQEGDSLWKIAKNHRITISKLASANHLDESTVLRPGMKLVIP